MMKLFNDYKSFYGMSLPRDGQVPLKTKEGPKAWKEAYESLNY